MQYEVKSLYARDSNIMFITGGAPTAEIRQLKTSSKR